MDTQKQQPSGEAPERDLAVEELEEAAGGRLPIPPPLPPADPPPATSRPRAGIHGRKPPGPVDP